MTKRLREDDSSDDENGFAQSFRIHSPTSSPDVLPEASSAVAEPVPMTVQAASDTVPDSSSSHAMADLLSSTAYDLLPLPDTADPDSCAIPASTPFVIPEGHEWRHGRIRKKKKPIVAKVS